MMARNATTFPSSLIYVCKFVTPSLVDSDSLKYLLSWAVSRNPASASSLSRAVVVSASISVPASAVQQMKSFRSIGLRMRSCHICVSRLVFSWSSASLRGMRAVVRPGTRKFTNVVFPTFDLIIEVVNPTKESGGHRS